MKRSDNFKKLIKNYNKENIKFSKHAEIRLIQRKLDKDFVIQKLFDIDNLISEEKQKDKSTYKLVYESSSKYRLVIVVTLSKRFVVIITAYKTSKKVEKLIKKTGALYISKKLIYK